MDHWCNIKNPIFGTIAINKPSIYYLYEFLGDSYEITQNNFIENLNHSKNINNNYEIRILREKYDNLDLFVKNYLPKYYNLYINYNYPIQKCDIFRYILMYLVGGIYSDLDVFINKPINSLISKYSWANVIFGIGRIKDINRCKLATKYETIRDGEPEISMKISNYFFISNKRNHPIWKDILDLAIKRSKKKIKSQYGIIYSTGPDLVTTAVFNNIHKYKDIAIIKLNEFQNYVSHQCSSSWRNNLQECEGDVTTT